jgi:hypothetical protein
MKHVEHSDSETQRLIERAFERDRMRLNAPPNAPSASLMQKLASGAPPAVIRPLGLFGSAAAKWVIALALGSAAAGVAYFARDTHPTVPVSQIQQPVHSITPSQQGTGQSTLKSGLTQPAAPLAVSRHAPLRGRPRSAISEDSLLREEVANPTVYPAPDSARITIHRSGQR